MAEEATKSLKAELEFITRLTSSADNVDGYVAAARAARKVLPSAGAPVGGRPILQPDSTMLTATPLPCMHAAHSPPPRPHLALPTVAYSSHRAPPRSCMTTSRPGE